MDHCLRPSRICRPLPLSPTLGSALFPFVLMVGPFPFVFLKKSVRTLLASLLVIAKLLRTPFGPGVKCPLRPLLRDLKVGSKTPTSYLVPFFEQVEGMPSSTVDFQVWLHQLSTADVTFVSP